MLFIRFERFAWPLFVSYVPVTRNEVLEMRCIPINYNGPQFDRPRGLLLITFESREVTVRVRRSSFFSRFDSSKNKNCFVSTSIFILSFFLFLGRMILFDVWRCFLLDKKLVLDGLIERGSEFRLFRKDFFIEIDNTIPWPRPSVAVKKEKRKKRYQSLKDFR